MKGTGGDTPLFGQVPAQQASGYFFRMGLFNILVAAVVTLPVLVPQLGLPLKLEVWPGTWMFISWFVFVIVGVAGTFVWSFIYSMVPKVYGKNTVSDLLALVQLTTFEGAVFALCAFMGIDAGYYGGTLYHNGFGQAVITHVIAWAVIPIGTLIVIALISTVTGIINVYSASE